MVPVNVHEVVGDNEEVSVMMIAQYLLTRCAGGLRVKIFADTAMVKDCESKAEYVGEGSEKV